MFFQACHPEPVCNLDTSQPDIVDTSNLQHGRVLAPGITEAAVPELRARAGAREKQTEQMNRIGQSRSTWTQSRTFQKELLPSNLQVPSSVNSVHSCLFCVRDSAWERPPTTGSRHKLRAVPCARHRCTGLCLAEPQLPQCYYWRV